MEESQAIWLKLGSRGEKGLADVLCFLGMNAHNKVDNEQAESFYKQSLALAKKCNHQRTIAGTTLFLGIIEHERGQIAPALGLYKQSLELSRGTGDLLLISLAAGNLGDLFLEQGDYEKVRPLFDQELEINEKLQFRFGLAATWISRGELYRHEGNYLEAEQCLENSMIVSRDLGLKGRISFNLYLLCLLALHRNDYSSAAVRFRKYFDFDRVLEEKISQCRFLTGMSAVSGGTNQPEHCAKLFGAAQAVLETSGFRMHQFDRAEFDRHIQIARDQLGNATFDTLSDEGHTMTMEQAIELAIKTKIE